MNETPSPDLAERRAYVRSIAEQLYELGYPLPVLVLGRCKRFDASEARALIAWFLRQQRWTQTDIGNVLSIRSSMFETVEWSRSKRRAVYPELTAAMAGLPVYRDPVVLTKTATLAHPTLQSLPILRERREVLVRELAIIEACIERLTVIPERVA